MVQNQPTLVVFHLDNQRSAPFGTSVKSKCFFRTNFFKLIDIFLNLASWHEGKSVLYKLSTEVNRHVCLAAVTVNHFLLWDSQNIHSSKKISVSRGHLMETPANKKKFLCWSNLKYFSVYFMYIFSSKLWVTLSIVILIWHERLFYVGSPLKEIRPYSVHVGILFRYRIMMSAAWMLSAVTNNRWTVEKKWCDKKNKK